MSLQETPRGRLHDLAGPALRIFFRIAEAWSLDEHEQMRLLGISRPALLHTWRGGGLAEFHTETLERISLMIGIFMAINILLPDPARADAWMRTPNKAPLLQGEIPIPFLADGGIEELQALRAYLDAEVGDG